MLQQLEQYRDIFLNHRITPTVISMTFEEVIQLFHLQRKRLDLLIGDLFDLYRHIKQANISDALFFTIDTEQGLFIEDRGVFVSFSKYLCNGQSVDNIFIYRTSCPDCAFVRYYRPYPLIQDEYQSSFIDNYFHKSYSKEVAEFLGRQTISKLNDRYQLHHKYPLSDPLSVNGGKEVILFTKDEVNFLNSYLFFKCVKETLLSPVVSDGRVYYVTKFLSDLKDHIVRATSYRYEYFGETAYSVQYEDYGTSSLPTEKGKWVSVENLVVIVDPMSAFIVSNSKDNKAEIIRESSSTHALQVTMLEGEMSRSNEYVYDYTTSIYYTKLNTNKLYSIQFTRINQFLDFIPIISITDYETISIMKLNRVLLDLDRLVTPSLVSNYIVSKSKFGEAAKPILTPFLDKLFITDIRDFIPLIRQLKTTMKDQCIIVLEDSDIFFHVAYAHIDIDKDTISVFRSYLDDSTLCLKTDSFIALDMDFASLSQVTDKSISPIIPYMAYNDYYFPIPLLGVADYIRGNIRKIL